MRFKIDTPKEGTTKEVRKFAFLPKMVDDGKDEPDYDKYDDDY